MSILDHRVPESSPKPSNESPGMLFGIALAAFMAYWVVTPAVYQLMTGRALLPTTQPVTQPAQLDPHDLVALSITSPMIGLLVLFIGNLLFRKCAFEKIGFTFAGLRHRGWKQGLIAAAIILPAMFGVMFLTEEFWESIHFAHPSEHDLLRVLGGESNGAIRDAIIVSAIILAPLFEEFFFRGMIQRAILGSMEPLRDQLAGWDRWIAILVTSLAFTAVHGALWLAPPIFFLSMCMGYAYERTKNLWTSIIVHASFNAASVAMFLMFR